MGGDRTGEGNMGKRKCKRAGEVGREWVGTGQGKVTWKKGSGKGRGGGKRVSGDRTGEGIMGKREWKG